MVARIEPTIQWGPEDLRDVDEIIRLAKINHEGRPVQFDHHLYEGFWVKIIERNIPKLDPRKTEFDRKNQCIEELTELVKNTGIGEGLGEDDIIIPPDFHIDYADIVGDDPVDDMIKDLAGVAAGCMKMTKKAAKIGAAIIGAIITYDLASMAISNMIS